MKKTYTIFLLLFTSFSFGQQFNTDLVPFYHNQKFSFCDSSGKTQQIPGEFDFVKPFTGDYAEVKNNGLWGIIDKTGKTILPVKYKDISIQYQYPSSREGAYFEVNNRTAFYDNTGKQLKTIPESEYPIAMWIDEHVFKLNDKYGFYNDGDTTMPAIYDNMSYLYGKLIVKKDNKEGLYYTNGKVILPIEYDDISIFDKSGMYLLYKNKNEKPCLFFPHYVHTYNFYKHTYPSYYAVYDRYSDNYLLVEDNNHQKFYIDLKTGKELKK